MNTRSMADLATPAAPVTHRVVVGFDGSAAAISTMEWAATEAASRGAALRVVTCLAVPPPVDYYGIGARQRQTLAEAVSDVRRRHPGLSVKQASTHLDPQDALVDEAADADLLIVGGSSSGAAKRWLLGSVPRTAARRSSCPVIVVRGAQHQPLRRIIVGVDSSNASAAALDWAVVEADCHDAELVVVHAWQRPAGAGQSMRGNDLDRADAKCIVDLAVRQCKALTNRVVTGELIEGGAAAVLAAASENADLVAVGSRGRSGFKTMLFGSVALFVAEHAACPVAVIHPHLRTRDRGP